MKPMSHVNNFDAIRFIAASMVMLGHGFVLTGRADPFALWMEKVEGLASIGVTIFFVISGYLIAASWQNQPDLITFARKRALRILPALIICVVFSVFVMGPLLTTLPVVNYFHHSTTWQYLLNMVLYTGNNALPGVYDNNPIQHNFNGSVWTLPVEVSMYIGVAVFGMLGFLTPKRILVVVTVLFALLCHWVKPDYTVFKDTVPLYFVLKHGMSFFIGSAFYIWRDKIAWTWELALFAIILSLISVQSPYSRTLFIITVPYLVLFFAFTPTIKWNHFAKYGDFSYGMYIYGFPIEQLCQHLLGHTSFYRYMAITYPLVILCGFLSWHLIEKRALGWARIKNISPAPTMEYQKSLVNC